MRLAFTFFLSLMFISCSAVGLQNRPYSEHEIQMRDYLHSLTVENKSKTNLFSLHSPRLLPEPSDFQIYEIDLNKDGRVDFLASSNHILLSINGRMPLYIMLANDYDSFDFISKDLTLNSFTVSVDDVKPFPILKIGDSTFVYDGRLYQESK